MAVVVVEVVVVNVVVVVVVVLLVVVDVVVEVDVEVAVDVLQDARSMAATSKKLKPNQITLFFNFYLLLFHSLRCSQHCNNTYRWCQVEKDVAC